MNPETIQIMITMICYMLAVILIGVAFAKRANKSSEDYFLGGRTLGPWVTAMSAEASDMSGWLLMGLPGVAYWCGVADAAWTAIGLAVGTYINWLITSKRLRRYSERVKAITLPEFFSNRFHEGGKVIMTIAALFILIFFTVYASSCLVTCGKLFSTLFGFDYIPMMIVGAVFVLLYTIIGGFLAESASDFMQAVVMIVALIVVVTVGCISAGGVDDVITNAKQIPGFLEFFGMATPVTDANGVQQIVNGVPQFGERAGYSAMTILSGLAWGLGYFGMPQVLLRFMAIRQERELTRSRRIATVWVLISLTIAVFIGIMGRQLFPTSLTTASDQSAPADPRGSGHGRHTRRDHQLLRQLSADSRKRLCQEHISGAFEKGRHGQARHVDEPPCPADNLRHRHSHRPGRGQRHLHDSLLCLGRLRRHLRTADAL